MGRRAGLGGDVDVSLIGVATQSLGVGEEVEGDVEDHSSEFPSTETGNTE